MSVLLFLGHACGVIRRFNRSVVDGLFLGLGGGEAGSAAALGDLGRHFPDSDDRWKGVSSMKLLEHVAQMIRAKGYCVGNIDATIVAQRPKFAPYIEEMRRNIAEKLDLELEQVNVKATTEEKLGFTGEEKGISAYAVASLERMEEK